MAAIPGIDQETAQLLVRSGFHSLEGLLGVDLEDLSEILGPERAATVIQAATAEREKRETAEQS